MNWNDIENDVKHFLLRLICYHVNLLHWPIPDDLQEMLEEFPGHEDPYFTEDMRRILIYVLAHLPSEDPSFIRRYCRSDSIMSLSQELLEDYNHGTFIEFCFYLGHITASAYRNGYNLEGPRRFFDVALVILEFAHGKGLFTNQSWASLQNAALDLMQEVRDLEWIKDRELRAKQSREPADQNDPPSPRQPMQA